MFAFRKDKSHVKNNRTKDIWFVIAKWNSFGLRFEPGSNNPLQHPRRISIFLLVRLRCVQTALSYRDRFKFSSITFSRLIGQLAKINSSISPLCTFHRSSVFRLKLFHTLCRCDTKNVHKNHARVWPLLACHSSRDMLLHRANFFPAKTTDTTRAALRGDHACVVRKLTWFMGVQHGTMQRISRFVKQRSRKVAQTGFKYRKSNRRKVNCR